LLEKNNKKRRKRKMKEKMSIVAGAGIAVLLLVIVVLYLLGPGTIELYDVALIIVPLILVVGAITFLWDRLKNVRAGLPSADERSKKLHWKAGAYAYIATIWIAIGTMWYNIIFAENLGYPELNAGQVVAVIVLLSGMAWFALQFYFMKHGDIE